MIVKQIARPTTWHFNQTYGLSFTHIYKTATPTRRRFAPPPVGYIVTYQAGHAGGGLAVFRVHITCESVTRFTQDGWWFRYYSPFAICWPIGLCYVFLEVTRWVPVVHRADGLALFLESRRGTEESPTCGPSPLDLAPRRVTFSIDVFSEFPVSSNTLLPTP